MATPVRTFRCENEIWEPAKAKADREGHAMADILRQALINYVEQES